MCYANLNHAMKGIQTFYKTALYNFALCDFASLNRSFFQDLVHLEDLLFSNPVLQGGEGTIFSVRCEIHMAIGGLKLNAVENKLLK